jgi:serine/threonine protein kinase
MRVHAPDIPMNIEDRQATLERPPAPVEVGECHLGSPVLAVGTLVGGFRIEGVLGRGGMGVVYRATQLSLQREVALKLICADRVGETKFRRRFRREGMLQAALEHPNVVCVHEAGDSAHGLFIAMRLVRGDSLNRLIGSPGLVPGRLLRILAGVADGLDAAHRAGLIHRDVKPRNILVASDHGFLSDFGLSCGGDLESMTDAPSRAGTPAYMAPEQIRGERPDARSDIYALGAVLYECLTGLPPFPRGSDIEVMCAHLYSPPPSIRELQPGLPNGLDRVLAAAMAKQPERRQRTAAELIAQAAWTLA